MQKDTNRLTVEGENQNLQELLNAHTEVELSDAELSQIKGAAGTPFNQYAAVSPFNNDFARLRAMALSH